MVLRAQGADPVRALATRPRLVRLVERALRDGASLLRPEVVERRLTLTERRHGQLRLSDGSVLRAPAVLEALTGATDIVMLLATVGEPIARAVQAAARTEPAFALALDAVGTAAVQEVADAHRRALGMEVADRGWRVGVPVAPGMDGWSLLEGQRFLFGLSGTTGAIRLSETAVMTPRHSLSMLLGLGPDIDPDRTICDCCSARTRCRHRTVLL
jgi:hypothetical protein